MKQDKYVLSYSRGGNSDQKITVEFNEVYISEVLGNMMSFLKAVGFVFDKGDELQVVGSMEDLLERLGECDEDDNDNDGETLLNKIRFRDIKIPSDDDGLSNL